jgi:hypothetical protein
MTLPHNQSSKDDIITQSELFARDFGIDLLKYPRFKAKDTVISWRTEHNANGSNGWTEGEPAVTVPRWIVVEYAKMQALKQPKHNKERLKK